MPTDDEIGGLLSAYAYGRLPRSAAIRDFRDLFAQPEPVVPTTATDDDILQVLAGVRDGYLPVDHALLHVRGWLDRSRPARMLDVTRHRVLRRMGESDLGKSWSWIEDRVRALVEGRAQPERMSVRLEILRDLAVAVLSREQGSACRVGDLLNITDAIISSAAKESSDG